MTTTRQTCVCARLTAVFAIMLAGFAAKAATTTNPISCSANSWLVNRTPENSDSLSHDRRMKWENPKSVIRTYFKTSVAGELTLAVRARTEQGPAKIRFTFEGRSKELTIANTAFEVLPVIVAQTKPGYHFLEMQGVERQGSAFPEITDLLVIGGEAAEKLYYITSDVYWARRGPSVHLNLIPPKGTGDVLYTYSEITVPEGSDVPGSYFMANGFAGGYFGMQAKSPTEGWFLFSVWSPFQTDNPKEIPDHLKVKLLKKGTDVHGGEFGGEGSGGQSYRRFLWKTGLTYKFLLKGEPAGTNATDFTAWIFAPEVGTWELMASFRQPKNGNYLKHPHSFLENFYPDNGHLPRMAYYSNQWLYGTDGKWREITEFSFSVDATGHKKARLDFTGGVEGDSFFLKNCGFFDADVKPGTRFTCKPTGRPPVIDFSKLP